MDHPHYRRRRFCFVLEAMMTMTMMSLVGKTTLRVADFWRGEKMLGMPGTQSSLNVVVVVVAVVAVVGVVAAPRGILDQALSYGW